MCDSVFRSADCHCGLQDPPRCSACSALPGALHPAASAHYGLPEGTLAGWDSSSLNLPRLKIQRWLFCRTRIIFVFCNCKIEFKPCQKEVKSKMSFSKREKYKYSQWTRGGFIAEYYSQFLFFFFYINFSSM